MCKSQTPSNLEAGYDSIFVPGTYFIVVLLINVNYIDFFYGFMQECMIYM